MSSLLRASWVGVPHTIVAASEPVAVTFAQHLCSTAEPWDNALLIVAMPSRDVPRACTWHFVGIHPTKVLDPDWELDQLHPIHQNNADWDQLMFAASPGLEPGEIDLAVRVGRVGPVCADVVDDPAFAAGLLSMHPRR